MSNQLIHDIVKKHLHPPDRYVYGFANLTGLLPAKFDGYASGISIVRKLDDDIIDGILDAPTPEYLHHYEEINHLTLALAESIAIDLNREGIGALAIKPTILTDNRELDEKYPTLRYDISHKMIATRAGLGWIGKTDLFISKKFGARIRLVSILLNSEAEPESKPIDKSRCGTCSTCVNICPVGAATGQLWDIHTDRDIFFDAIKCRDKCTEFGRDHLKVDRKICGICVAACPIGRKN
jgi:epoxyqueuosine reductase